METFSIKSSDVHLGGFHWPSHQPQAQQVLALHGFTGDGQDYAPLAQATQGHLDWFSIDWVGHGLSDAPEDLKHYTTQASVQHIAQIEKSTELKEYLLIGYSMGGRIALNYALQRPDQIKALILIGANPGLTNTQEREQRQREDEHLADYILTHSMRAFIDKWTEQTIIATQKHIAKPIRKQMLERRYRNRPIGLANSLRGLGTGVMPVLWEHLNKLTCPCLLVSGIQDLKYSAIAKDMETHLPHATHAQISDAGHCAHLEQPSHFCQLLHNFIERLPVN